MTCRKPKKWPPIRTRPGVGATSAGRIVEVQVEVVGREVPAQPLIPTLPSKDAAHR
jgi:hypothetical protein